MEETLLEKTVHALVFLAICAAIIFIGWREPLRYRFMSPEEITETELAAHPEARKSWTPTRTRLNDPPRDRTGVGNSEIFSLPHRKAEGLAPPAERTSPGR